MRKQEEGQAYALTPHLHVTLPTQPCAAPSTKKTQDAAFYHRAILQVAEQLQERTVFPRITSCPRW